MLANGTILNDTYQIVERIGSGGVGVIYKAYHLRLQKYVVIKMIKENYVGNINVRGEVDLLKRLHHPCLPQVYDFIQIDRQVYTVMDYISGRNLEQYKQEGLPIWQEDVEKWLIQLCEVLVYLHKQKPAIIHSDIKPQNIIIDEDGNANLIDFNISFEEDTMDIQGVSQAYASSEQLEAIWLIKNGYECPDNLVDASTDIYSLGAAFYYILTGLVPHSGIDEEYPITYFDIPYSAALLQIIHKAMQQDKKKRYLTASKMLSDIKNLKKKTLNYRLKRIGIVIGSICAALIAAGTVTWGVGTLKVKEQKRYQMAYDKVSMLGGYTQEDEEQIENFLDNTRYKAYLKQNPDKKAALLYKIGNYCFIKEDYIQAEQNFKQAVELDYSNTDYKRDYVVALVRNNKTAEAQNELGKYKNDGMDKTYVDEMTAEILYIQGDYSKVINTLEQLLNVDITQSLQSRCLYLLQMTCSKYKQYTQCINILNNVHVKSQNMDVYNLVKMNIYMQMGQDAANTLKEQYYREAQESYTNIQNKDICTLKDCLNISTAYQNTGRYDLALDILVKLQSEYKDDYRIYMQEAFCYYYQAKAGNGNYSKVKELYNQALPLYKAVYVNGNSDDEMNKLEKLVGSLK